MLRTGLLGFAAGSGLTYLVYALFLQPTDHAFFTLSYFQDDLMKPMITAGIVGFIGGLLWGGKARRSKQKLAAPVVMASGPEVWPPPPSGPSSGAEPPSV